MGCHFVGFDKIETGFAGLDVVAILESIGVGGVIIHFEIPLAGESVAVGVAVAESGLAPLDDGKFDSDLEKQQVQHRRRVLAATPQHGRLIYLIEPGTYFRNGILN